MGDIVSLVDSIQDDYLPPIPLRYKKMEPQPVEEKVGKSIFCFITDVNMKFYYLFIFIRSGL